MSYRLKNRLRCERAPIALADVEAAAERVQREVRTILQIEVSICMGLLVALGAVSWHVRCQVWCDVLCDGGWDDELRLRSFSRMLVANEFTHLSQLEDADSPVTWEGAGEFTGEEFALLDDISKKRSRPQRCDECVGFLLVHVGASVFISAGS